MYFCHGKEASKGELSPVNPVKIPQPMTQEEGKIAPHKLRPYSDTKTKERVNK